ncbi:hypothetical protein BDZ97DRAFT_1906593 [Flammula alnicola]|nr:hypothetical protein BDZ97DRAFT_1906593 [Flammula alnicola]
MPRHICEGCDHIFPTVRGFLSHLRQTRDPNLSNSDSASESESSGCPPVQPFAGDAFGSATDYAGDHFGQQDIRIAWQQDGPNPVDSSDSEHEPNPIDGSDSDNSDREAEMVAELEAGWEAERADAPEDGPQVGFEQPRGQNAPVEGPLDEELEAEATAEARQAETFLMGEGHGITPKVKIRYTVGTGDWAPFQSKMDWEVARWAKLRGQGSTAFTDLLAIDGVRDALGLSYKNSLELNKKIDDHLPGRPKFHRHEVVVQGEAMELYSRDVMECIQALWGDPDFAGELIFQPERHYADDDETGKWWWKTQKEVESKTEKTKCTIVPVIISSDKTQLTQFCNKSAYPPSRQGQVLLAYLPTSRLSHITNRASRAAVSPTYAGRAGVVLTSGDGARRRCFPIYSVFVGDYPEQVLVTLVKTGKCPVCPAAREGIGSLDSIHPPRDSGPIRRALRQIKHGPLAFTRACQSAGIKPLYQGVFKHILAWIYSACGEDEIDARCCRLPPNHHIRLFMKGITQLSRVTGTEHDQISRFILGLLVDIRLPDGLSNARLVRAVRALLDFISLSKYPTFHDNLDIFVDLGIHDNFDIPKFHFAGHYRYFVELYGTTDNYNTEYTERLHIDMAKDAYAATNCKDEYPQMTLWLERREKILQHDKFIRRRVNTASQINLIKPLPSLIPLRHQIMTKNPSARAVSLDDLRQKYGATDFVPALSRFIAQYQHPTYSKTHIERIAATLHIPFSMVLVFHRLKFWSHDVYAADPLAKNIVDSLHVEPARLDKYDNIVPGRFDVALINYGDGGASGVQGYCTGRIRCIFSLPPSASERWFPHGLPLKHLAYVEWYTPFRRSSFEPNSKMYRVSPLMSGGAQKVSVIPISLIRESIQLFPKFGPAAPTSWKSSNVLYQTSVFYVNLFLTAFNIQQYIRHHNLQDSERGDVPLDIVGVVVVSAPLANMRGGRLGAVKANANAAVKTPAAKTPASATTTTVKVAAVKPRGRPKTPASAPAAGPAAASCIAVSSAATGLEKENTPGTGSGVCWQ